MNLLILSNIHENEIAKNLSEKHICALSPSSLHIYINIYRKNLSQFYI
jgi:hypothetical protein